MTDFCRHCGSHTPKRMGEGTCPICDPEGCKNRSSKMRVIYNPMFQNVPIKSWCKDIEQSAFEQALQLTDHPAIFKHVALMPDVHAGKGMPIGGVVALQDCISPNLVGVDIGCGMCAVNTGLSYDEHKQLIPKIREMIVDRIPVGFKHRPRQWVEDNYWQVPKEIIDIGNKHLLLCRLDALTEGRVTANKVQEQLGTLGGGNHFIEIQKDTDGIIWVMIHSGSRNIGLQIADLYNKIAVKKCKKWHTNLPNKDLAFLPFDDSTGQQYFQAMTFALDFALANRKIMMMEVHRIFSDCQMTWKGDDEWIDDMINIHHNYASHENHYGRNVIVHRKGATLARKGTIGIIPGSMGTKSYIVRGLGNPESFNSCSHGAGRIMSRTKAKQTITMDEFTESMKGVEYTPIEKNLDEAPGAYKDIETVMEQQKDLVEILTELTPVAVVKG